MKSIAKPSERGNAVLEFAISWTVLWLIFSGIFQFGYSFYLYNVLQTSVANAAQLGSKMNYDLGNPSTFTTGLKNMVLFGDTTEGSVTLVPNLKVANVSVFVTADSGSGIPRDITVSIVDFKIDGIFKSFLMVGKPRASMMYSGRVTCAGC